jgi:predicted kinase
VLVLVNGAPGVGKSTLAGRLAREEPLSLVIDVDGLRTSLGRWDEVDESKVVARDLAVALAEQHLRSGRVVIVPQLVARPEFLDRLRGLAADASVPFVEVVLTDGADAIASRFRARRDSGAAGEHPEVDLDDADFADEIARTNERLVREGRARGAVIVDAGSGPDAAVRALDAALDTRWVASRDGVDPEGPSGASCRA